MSAEAEARLLTEQHIRWSIVQYHRFRRGQAEMSRSMAALSVVVFCAALLQHYLRFPIWSGAWWAIAGIFSAYAGLDIWTTIAMRRLRRAFMTSIHQMSRTDPEAAMALLEEAYPAWK